MSHFGKWSQTGVPRKGWACTGIEDLGETSETCEMCELQKIRYVHYMEHPDYPESLACGCICAGKMEEDYAAAKRREKTMKNAVRRRKRWLSRKWLKSQSGNDYIKTDGYRIVIFRKSSGWSGTITNIATTKATEARKIYPTQDAAKLAAFDGMIWLQSH